MLQATSSSVTPEEHKFLTMFEFLIVTSRYPIQAVATELIIRIIHI